ncbi:hypothetical protein J1N35_003177 [Gossypium stocksii]|uniref:Reverse transcriptase zinc-binding domain-containing protein n=1 Tax=Gossypium stocksii TaxID=47602 RepID=A0A9D3WML7_9ROSI|nr:hypothetical protein J1N35_003177 [Gossypium stocksii]
MDLSNLGVQFSNYSECGDFGFYGDDCILFGEAKRRAALTTNEILREYKTSSGQGVNFDKSTVFFSKNTSEEDRQAVVNQLGVRSSSDVERYLGLPSIVGKKKKESFQVLKDRIKLSIDNWSNRYLSQGGKESIWAAKGLLRSGLCWKIGRGNKISIWNDCWIPGSEKVGRQTSKENNELHLVLDLIDCENKTWKAELINNTFQTEIAQKILQIPLTEVDYEDFQVWKGEPSLDFSVRSAYKLLQYASLDPTCYLLQVETKEFYKKLWDLQLPSKITLIIWRISWNYIPTLINLRHKRMVINDTCPRCSSGAEDNFHVFRQCPTTNELWQALDLSWLHRIQATTSGSG